MMKSIKPKIIYHPAIKLIFLIVLFQYLLLDFSVALGETVPHLDHLTDVERSWLDAHPIIRLAPDPEFQPIEYFDENGNYAGIGADYVRLIAKKLGIKFEIIKCTNWDDVLARTKRREVDVLNAVVKTPEREKYLNFPPPYLKIPSVIIVRKKVTGELTLDRLKGMNVVMISGYGYVELIRNKHPEMKIELVSDLKAALRKVSFGMADAFVGDLATASFYIESEGISNLKLAGESEPPNISGFAVRSDWPELSSILEKGVALLTEEERKTIFNKWIRLAVEPAVTMREFKILIMFIVSFISLLIGGFLLWNRQLKRKVDLKTDDLTKEINERKRTQEALKESEEKFRAIAETSPLAIYMSEGIEQKTVYINPTFIRLFGYTMDEVPNADHWWPLAYPDEKYRKQVTDEWQKKVTQAIETNSEIDPIEVVVTCKDGMKKNISWSFITIGKHNWAAGLDLTDRKQAEADLYENQIIFRSFLENSPVYIFFKDNEIRPLKLSRNYEQLLGMPLEDIIGKTMDDLFPSDLAKTMIETDKRILREGKNVTVVEQFAERTYETTKFPIFIKNQPNMLAGFTLDITDRKKAEEVRENLEAQLRQTHKMEAVGTLAGGIAHDFNNILSGIIGYSELIRREVSPDTVVGKDIVEVITAGKRAAALVQQILTFSRKTNIEKQPLYPHLIVEEALKMLRASLPTSIVMEEDIDPECGAILADPTNIHQVVVNLCTNALHAMPAEKGRLTVKLHQQVVNAEEISSETDVSPGYFVIISVSDTGCGMDKSTIEWIFDPYFTTKEFGSGTGLGLAVVHGIAQEAKGFIRVTSAPGKGSTFDVYFPILQETMPNVNKGTEVDIQRGGVEHILIVDDEPLLVKLMQRMLEHKGYRITKTTDSRSALEKIREHPEALDLLITDQTMPGLTGMELALAAKEIKPNLPVILCTGHSSLVSREDALRLGVDRYVSKPILGNELTRAVRELLDQQNS